MATNLTPAQLAALQAALYQQPTSGSGYTTGPTPSNYNYTDPSGSTFHTTYSSGGSGIEQGGDIYGPATGYVQDQVAGKNQPGDIQSAYDLYGQYVATGAIPKDTSFQEFLLLGAGMATAGVLTGMGVGGGAAGSLGAANGSWDILPAASGSTVSGAAPAWSTAAADSQLANAAIGDSALSGYTAAGAGGVTASPVMAGGAGASVLSGAASGMGGLLGPAATLLGGLAGSQGNSASTTTAKEIPEWLKPYITGSDGLLSKTNSLLQQQTAPGALAGFDQMKNVGMNLLNQPIRQNGFNLFTGR